MFCIVSKNHPVPDLSILDKQIILCEKNNITPIICINKADIEEENNVYRYIKEVYPKIGYEVIEVSATENIGIDILLSKIKGKVTAFSGHSGVGKSSITKKIINKEEETIEVGNLMKKINRGNHTTKYVKLYYVNGGYIADTPGFSSLELVEGIEKKELKKYFREFADFTCKYLDCNHVTEDIKECEIKKAVEENKIDKKRYDRYVTLYNLLEVKEKNKYKNKKR